MTERRRRIQILVCETDLFALCEENRLWQLLKDRLTWVEIPPLPGIEVDSDPHLSFDEAPPALQDLQNMVHYLAQNPSLPLGDTQQLPASDPQDSPPTTYDKFEDPLA